MPISYLPNGGVILAWLSIIAAVSIIIYNPAAKIQKKIETAKKLRKKNGFHDVVV